MATNIIELVAGKQAVPVVKFLPGFDVAGAGGAAGRQVVIMANVTAVNSKEGFVTLRGPKGNSVDVSVSDPAQLKLVKVGDQVEAVYTEAVAVTVNHVPKPAKK